MSPEEKLERAMQVEPEFVGRNYDLCYTLRGELIRVCQLLGRIAAMAGEGSEIHAAAMDVEPYLRQWVQPEDVT